MNYTLINQFVKSLATHRNKLSKQQIKTLRGQALSGDLEGAHRGLEKIMKRTVPNGNTKNIS